MSDVFNEVVCGTSWVNEATTAREALRQLADESGMTFDELLELWSTDTATQLAAASTALAAGDLGQAARLVHSASGACGICKIATLAEELKTAENLAKDGRADAATEALKKAERRFRAINTALNSGTQP